MLGGRVTLREPFSGPVEAELERLEADDVMLRIWRRDHTVWGPDPTEIADRLGWLRVWQTMRASVPRLNALAARAAADGLTRAVVCGMGGSSLAPETLAVRFGARADRLELGVLDTTHPDELLALERTLDLDRTLFVVSSKSGTTTETLSQLDYFWARVPRGDRFVAITDPGTPLEATATERDFREVVHGDPEIGGRYSALSPFGLVPAALLGVDVDALLDGAEEMAELCGPGVPVAENPAAQLGAVIGALAREGRDKLTLVLADALAPLGPWIEQLVAESTGKAGTGILPVEGEDVGVPAVYGSDRVFVSLDGHPALEALEAAGHPVASLEAPGEGEAELGAQLFVWELAVAVAGSVLGINPFDQPNVQEAKEATKAVLEQDAIEDPGFDDVEALLDHVREPDYLAIQAYLPRNDDIEHRLHAVRMRLRDRLRVATTVGFGPRFLHSTGQLHKGGPESGVFVQVVDDPVEDAPIPGRPYSFGTLLRAQALGDLRALRERGRRVARTRLSDLESV